MKMNILTKFVHFSNKHIIYHRFVQLNIKKYFVVIYYYRTLVNSMGRKIISLLVMVVVIALVLPVGGVTLQKTDETVMAMNIDQPASQLEIRLWGGLGIHALIKNTGTTDIIGANIRIVFDGPGILWGTHENSSLIDFAAGRTKHVIFPVYGFGATNIELIIDSITTTGSAKVLFYFVFRVK